MSDQQAQQTQADFNDLLVMIVGESATGKSASLQKLKDPKTVLYLNCENNKRLPFPSQFHQRSITDPMSVYQFFTAFDAASNLNTLVIDTLTFLMNLYESVYVANAADGRSAWANYGNFFRTLMSQYVAKSKKVVVFLAHTRNDKDSYGRITSKVPVKGSLQNEGIEAFFSCIIAAKKVPLIDLVKYKNPLLTITPDDEVVGYKHVFQTRLTKETTGETIRHPMGMWSVEETFIDNNLQFVIDRLKQYYNIP